MPTRRALLCGMAGGLAAMGAATGRAELETAALRSLAQKAGLEFGAAAGIGQINDDPGLRAALLREVDFLVPENDLKMATVRPGPTQNNFDPFDQLAAFADKNHRRLRGHCLIWHKQNPPWLGAALKDAARPVDVLQAHIDLVVERYRGRMQSWDVVNEAIDPASGRADGLRPTPWLDAVGPTYIERAFRVAHAADPKARLVYNDYGCEYATPEGRAKRAVLLRLVDNLVRRGVPLHAVGLESHLDPKLPFSAPEFGGFLGEIGNRGLDIYLTELDVTDHALPASLAERDAVVANHARDYLAAALATRKLKLLATWGISDRYSWLNSDNSLRRSDGLPSRGLPLDDAMRRKPLWFAIADVLKDAPAR